LGNGVGEGVAVLALPPPPPPADRASSNSGGMDTASGSLLLLLLQSVFAGAAVLLALVACVLSASEFIVTIFSNGAPGIFDFQSSFYF